MPITTWPPVCAAIAKRYFLCRAMGGHYNQNARNHHANSRSDQRTPSGAGQQLAAQSAQLADSPRQSTRCIARHSGRSRLCRRTVGPRTGRRIAGIDRWSFAGRNDSRGAGAGVGARRRRARSRQVAGHLRSTLGPGRNQRPGARSIVGRRGDRKPGARSTARRSGPATSGRGRRAGCRPKSRFPTSCFKS